MDDHIEVLLQEAAAAQPTASHRLPAGPAIRARAERGRRRRAVAALAVVAVLLGVPVAAVVLRPAPAPVLLDRPSDATSEPAATGNPAVYAYDEQLAASVEGDLAAAVHVVLEDGSELDHGVITHLGTTVVVTADVPMALDLTGLPGAAVRAIDSPVLEGTEVRPAGDVVDLEPGVPRLLQVLPTADIPDDPPLHLPPTSADPTPAPPATTPVPPTAPPAAEDALALAAADGRTGRLVIRRVVAPVTGDDLGLPGDADLADQRLPRPQIGEAIPTQLQDGTPVWVVGVGGEEVAVVAARSPGAIGGLVSWCATLHGFQEPAYGAAFRATGEYVSGPAPAGLPTYAVDVADDHITVTRRNAPEPRPHPLDDPTDFIIPPIPGASIPQNRFCGQHPGLQASSATADDRQDDPHWRQHDLSAWPAFDGQRDGWYRTDEAPYRPGGVDPSAGGGPDLVIRGDLLVHRVGGETVDVAAAPGTAEVVPAGSRLNADPYVAPGSPDDAPATLFTGTGDGPGGPDCTPDVCVNGWVRTLDVVWVTRDGLVRVDHAEPPTSDAVLTPTAPTPQVMPRAADVVLDAVPGDLVRIEVHDRGSVRLVEAVGRPGS